MTGVPPGQRLAVCIEETLGHRTHGQNLERAFAAKGLGVDVFKLDFRRLRRLPLPWALRGSYAAYESLRGADPYDVTLFHTQTVALLAPRAVRGRRYIVSLDASPIQMDEMGRWYQHRRQPRLLEAAKRRWYAAIFERASGVVAWLRWAARSAIEDYGAEPDRILVAHPGGPAMFFNIPRTDGGTRERPRILFVGGDLERKDGDSLLRAFSRLQDVADLTLVTEAPVEPHPSVDVRHGIRPGTQGLLDAFAEADIFCLPTLRDCTPLVIDEAMAAGLPVITTDVASNVEWVPPETGLLVPPADDDTLEHALRQLVDEPETRARLGGAAREWARTHMDAERNAGRVVDFMTALAA